jgi:heptosyltransferase-1
MDPVPVLLTATSRDDKLWPEERWIALGRAPCRTGPELPAAGGQWPPSANAQRLAQDSRCCRAAADGPRCELARQLAAARIVVGVDTGLVHLAAALGRPTLALFAPPTRR